MQWFIGRSNESRMGAIFLCAVHLHAFQLFDGLLGSIPCEIVIPIEILYLPDVRQIQCCFVILAELKRS